MRTYAYAAAAPIGAASSSYEQASIAPAAADCTQSIAAAAHAVAAIVWL